MITPVARRLIVLSVIFSCFSLPLQAKDFAQAPGQGGPAVETVGDATENDGNDGQDNSGNSQSNGNSQNGNSPGSGNRPSNGNPQDNRPQGTTLKITVEHSETLPPLPDSCKKGATYFGAAQMAPRSRGSNQPSKYALPAWLAGTWQRTQSTEKSRVELPSGKKLKTAGRSEAKVQDKFGTYKDEKGNIWQVFYPQFASGEVDRGAMMDNHTVTKYNLEVVNDNTVCVEVQAYHIVVSKDKRQIVQSYQDEEINTYTRLSDGKLQTDSSVKVFDALGKPMLLTRSVSDEIKIEPFTAAASQSVGQQAAQFQRFMQQYQGSQRRFSFGAPGAPGSPQGYKPIPEGYSRKAQPQQNQLYQPQQGYPSNYQRNNTP